MPPSAHVPLQKKASLWDNIISQISMDMKKSARPVRDNALIISFVAAFLSLYMRHWMGINLIRHLAGAVLLSVLQRRPIQITKEKLVK